MRCEWKYEGKTRFIKNHQTSIISFSPPGNLHISRKRKFIKSFHPWCQCAKLIFRPELPLQREGQSPTETTSEFSESSSGTQSSIANNPSGGGWIRFFSNFESLIISSHIKYREHWKWKRAGKQTKYCECIRAI